MAEGPGAPDFGGPSGDIGGGDGFEPPIHATEGHDGTLDMDEEHRPAFGHHNDSKMNQMTDIERWLHLIVRNRKNRRRLNHLNSEAEAPSNLQRLNRLLSTNSGSDKVLMLAGYTLMAGAAALERVNAPAYRPETTSDQTKPLAPPPPTPPAFPGAKSLESRLRNFSNLISDVRIFTRLWGIFGILEWALQTLDSPPRDLYLRRIAYSQVIVNIFYQIMENLAYLAEHKILRYSVDTQKKLWAYSCRFWAAHVALDLGRLFRVRHLRQQRRTTKTNKAVTIAEEQEWWRQITCNLCWIPLTVHWSMLDGGYLNASTTGVLGTIAGVLTIKHAWRQTAEPDGRAR